MSTYLHGLIDYHSWANKGLIEILRTLPPETLDKTAEGVYGSVRETFAHMLSSELSYQRRLASFPPAAVRVIPECPDLDLLQQIAAESAVNLATLVISLPERGTRVQTSDVLRAAGTILTQLIMHGCEHRTHVTTILGAHGIEPPEIDSWAYGILVSGDDWPPNWGLEPPNQ